MTQALETLVFSTTSAEIACRSSATRAGILPPAASCALAEPLREALAEAVPPRDDACCRADDGKRHELRCTTKPRPQPGAQKARFAGARGSLDDQKPLWVPGRRPSA